MADPIQWADGSVEEWDDQNKLRISKPSLQNVKRNISSIATQGAITLNKIRNLIPKPPEQLVKGAEWTYEHSPVGLVDQGAQLLGEDVSRFLIDKGAPKWVGGAAALGIGLAAPGPGGKIQTIKGLDKARKIAIKANRVNKGINFFPPNKTLQPAYATAGAGNLQINPQTTNIKPNNPLMIKGDPRDINLTESTHWASKRRGTAKRFEDMGEGLRASTHHVGDAGTTGTAIRTHPEGDKILNRLFAKGQETGDSIYNYVTGYDTLINKAHIAKRNNLMKLYGIDDRTANDLLKVPKQITRKTKLTKADIGDHSKILEGINVSIAPKVKPGEFPPIRNKKGDVIFQATSQKEWDQRFRIVAEKLGLKDSNLMTDQVNTMIRNVNADPSLNIFSQDHMTYFHENYNKLPSVKKLNAAFKDGSYAKLSVDDAENLLTEALTDQRAIVVNYTRMKTKALLQRFPQLKTMSAKEITAFQKANPHEFALGIRGQGFNPSYKNLSKRETAVLNDDLGKFTTQIFGITDRPTPKSQMRFTAK